MADDTRPAEGLDLDEIRRDVVDGLITHDDIYNLCDEIERLRSENAELEEQVDYWSDTQHGLDLAKEKARADTAEAEVRRLRELIDSLYPAIKHGNASHKIWLAKAIAAHFAGEPLPEYVP